MIIAAKMTPPKKIKNKKRETLSCHHNTLLLPRQTDSGYLMPSQPQISNQCKIQSHQITNKVKVCFSMFTLHITLCLKQIRGGSNWMKLGWPTKQAACIPSSKWSMQSHVLTDTRLNTYDTVCFMAGALLLRPGEPCLGNELYCMLPSGLSDFPAWSTLTSDAERRICVGPIGDRVSKFCPLGGEAKLELAEERWVLLTTRAGTDTCEEKETDSRGQCAQ